MIGSWRKNHRRAPPFQHLTSWGNHYCSRSGSCILSYVRNSEATTSILKNTLPKHSGRHRHIGESFHQNHELSNYAQKRLIQSMFYLEYSTESPTSNSTIHSPLTTTWCTYLVTILLPKDPHPLFECKVCGWGGSKCGECCVMKYWAEGNWEWID